MKQQTLILLLTLPVMAQAGVYKCDGPRGKPVYQARPCEDQGKKGQAIELKPNLSAEKIKAAKAKLKNELRQIATRKEAQRKRDNEERMIRAEENKARATFESAWESKRQADAMEDRNRIEASKRY